MALSPTARGRVARRAAAGVAVAAVLSAGVHAAGASQPMPDAVAAQVPLPVSAIPPPAWHSNVGATHSPIAERMVAGRAGGRGAAGAARTVVPAGDALGVDVSSQNHPGGGPIDWAKVAAAGYKFAFIKA